MKQDREIKIEYLIKSARLADSKTTVDQRFANELKKRLLEEFLNKKPKNNNIFNILNFMKKRPKIIVVSTILSILITSVIGITLYNKSITKKSIDKNQIVGGVQIATLSANIKKINGDVKVKDENSDKSAEWEKVKEGMEIYSLFSVRTEADSKAVIEIADGSSIRLNENTEIILAKLSPDEIIVDQANGEVYHRVEKNPNREYRVISSANLQNLNITALGTAFNTIVNRDANLNIKCVESKISVNYDNEKPAELLTEGQEVNINLKNKSDVKICNIDGETLDNNWFKYNVELDQEKKSVLGMFANNQSPELEILEPANEFQTKYETVTIRGRVSQNALLKFKNGENWEIVNNNDGSFEKNVGLVLGKNTYEFKAYNQSGVKTVKTLVIERIKEINIAQVPDTKPKQEQISESVTEIQPEQGIFYITSIRSLEPGKVDIAWKFEGYQEKTGWKIVYSKNLNPEYPSRNRNDFFQYIDDPAVRNAVITDSALNEGGEFHFRVCRYSSTADLTRCDIYTPDIAINILPKLQPDPEPEPTPEPVQSIILTKTGNDAEIGLSWEPTGGLDVSNGYKLVWDRVSNPTYPKNAESTQYWGYFYIPGVITKISPIPLPTEFLSGKWYVRICRYTNANTCDVYSNEAIVEL